MVGFVKVSGISGTGEGVSYFDPGAHAADRRVDALVGGVKWGGAIGTGAVVTYSFPTSGSKWEDGYSSLNEPDRNFAAFTSAERAVARKALDAWEKVADITFVEVDETSRDVGDIRFARSSAVGSGAHAYFPGAYAAAGDVWVNPTVSLLDPYGLELLLHEIGHAIGMKHPFEGDIVLTAQQDNSGNTVMSYTPDGGPVDAPQSFDVLTARFLYGRGGDKPTTLGIDYVAYGGPNADRLYFNGGDDYVDAGDGDDTVAGGGGDDTLLGRGGDDMLTPGAGDDAVDAGLGVDIVFLDGALEDFDLTYFVTPLGGDAIRVDVAILAGPDGENRLYGVEFVALDGAVFTQEALARMFLAEAVGPPTPSNLTFDEDHWRGGAGDDAVFGLAGDDRMSGGAGDDMMDGGIGDDWLLSGLGHDQVWGADGADVIKSSGGADIVRGGPGDDLILAGDESDAIFGGGGNDIIKPGRGDDAINGEAGDDIIVGFRSNEVLSGGVGDDTLIGNLGDDVIIGGAGDDRMWGGPGRDVFLFDTAGFGRDRIVIDFRPSSDSIDFRGSGYDADDIRLREVDGKVVIDIIGSNDRIVINAERIGDLHASDFDDGVLIF